MIHTCCSIYLFVSRENKATTVIVSLHVIVSLVITDRNDTMTVVACCKIQCNTCHQMASLAFRFHKIQFRPGLRPGPRWGAYDAPPVGWKGGLSTPSAWRLDRDAPKLLKLCRAPERKPPSFFKLL